MSDNFNFSDLTKNGLEILVSSQAQDGSFPSLTSNNRDNFNNSHVCQSVFTTAIILSALHGIRKREVNRIKSRIAKFLLSQKSKQWTFNYWTRNSEQSKTMPYPDDLDDTTCALSALFLYNQKLINAEALAKFTLVLTTLESREGGPYRTWLVPESADNVWRDVDLAVNSNIAYFLSLCQVNLPNLTALFDEAILKRRYHSPYYPSPYPVIYFISRFYRGELSDKMIGFLLDHRSPNGGWGNCQDTALAVSALINLGYHSPDLSESIKMISKIDDWLPCPFYIGINSTKRRNNYYAGSRTLTAALCLEAIEKFSSLKFRREIIKFDHEREQMKQIGFYLDSLKVELGDGLSHEFAQVYQKLSASNFGRHICLAPAIFLGLINQPHRGIAPDTLCRLSLANILGWIAYTIYDDFLDDEGDPILLPVANFSLRKMVAIFESKPFQDENFSSLFHLLINTIDRANYWELKNCRCQIVDGQILLPSPLPKFLPEERISAKSIGHALCALKVLSLLDYQGKDKIKFTLEFFQHYLTAKQLHDDMHDWENDLRRGHLNPVNVLILKGYIKKDGKINKVNLQQADDLRLIFWRKTILEVGEMIKRHLKLAQEAIDNISVLDSDRAFKEFLLPLERSLKKTLRLRRQTIDFLKYYN